VFFYFPRPNHLPFLPNRKLDFRRPVGLLRVFQLSQLYQAQPDDGGIMKNTLQPSSIASLNNLEANYQILLKKGIMNNAKQNPSAARESAVTEIITCITEEVELFRKKTMRQPSVDVYDKAYSNST
jgi:hypothetical protein